MQIYASDATMDPSIKQITIELNGENFIIDLPQNDRLGNIGHKKVLLFKK
jgi:hypothetical protein